MSDTTQQEINTLRINSTIQSLTVQRNAALDEVVGLRGELSVLNHVLQSQMEVSGRMAAELQLARDEIAALKEVKSKKSKSETAS